MYFGIYLKIDINNVHVFHMLTCTVCLLSMLHTYVVNVVVKFVFDSRTT